MPDLIQALWIGPQLSTMEQLCIESFLRNGHPFHLYVYQDTEGVPAGTTIMDGNEILPSSSIFTYREYETCAGFANFFRYKLLLERGGWHVDLDTICLRPFQFAAPHVFSSQRRNGRPEVNLAALKVPPGSDIMRSAWEACQCMSTQELRWGQSGPELITRAVREYSLTPYVLRPEAFNPVNYPEWDKVLEPGVPWEADLQPYAVHLWNEMWRRAHQDKDIQYDPRCLYEQLKRHYLSGVPCTLALKHEPSEIESRGHFRPDASTQLRALDWPSTFKEPSISAVILTKNGAARIQRCLESIQRTKFADEIVVCIDTDTTDESFEVAQSFTPHVYFLQTKGYIESVLSRMASLCFGDFVLRVDDDECIAGNWDNEQFRMLAGFNDFNWALIPRRWVLPPGNAFLSDDPWFPDLQLRLFRNDPSIIAWPREIHRPMIVAGRPIVLFDRWLEHFNLADRSREERELKCQECLRLRPEFDLSHFYLWEGHGSRLMSRDASGFEAAKRRWLAGEKSPPLYRPGTEISFRADGNSCGYTLEGWSSPEIWGTWTDGNEAAIQLRLETAIQHDLVLTVDAFAYVTEEHPLVRVEVLYRGIVLEEWCFDSVAVVTRNLRIPVDLAAGDREPLFRFRILKAMSPLRLGHSDDRRLLGLGFHTLRLEGC